MKKLELVCIDPQLDFCVPNGTLAGVQTGTLLVPGAHDDMKRLSGWIDKNSSKIGRIRVTLDSHHRIDLAHKWFWKDKAGNHPLPLSQALAQNGAPTFISSKDIKDGTWMPMVPSLIPKMLAYTEALEKNQQFALTIWDDHCIIGTPGAAVVPELQNSLDKWCETKFATIDYVTKGSNVFTEHYGAFAAEVPDPEDPTTQLQTDLIKSIEDNDVIVWAGEASTHCVMTTMRQAFGVFGPDGIKKSVLLKDAMSGIPHAQKAFDDFLDEFQKKGLQVSTTVDFLK
jgi:nicotinamidase/pyrazinamidase